MSPVEHLIDWLAEALMATGLDKTAIFDDGQRISVHIGRGLTLRKSEGRWLVSTLWDGSFVSIDTESASRALQKASHVPDVRLVTRAVVAALEGDVRPLSALLDPDCGAWLADPSCSSPDFEDVFQIGGADWVDWAVHVDAEDGVPVLRCNTDRIRARGVEDVANWLQVCWPG